MRFGAGFWGSYPLRRYVELARLAERSRFDVVWIGDTQLVTPDLFSTMALCAAATSRIAIAAGVTNTVTRDPTVIAGGIAALNEFAGGRCLLGVGVGGSAVGQVGLAGEGAGEFRRKLDVIRRLARGETVSLNGVQARPRIAAPPVPLYLASSSPRNLELAGEVADGVIVNVGVAPELVREALTHVERGARRAGRPLDALEVVVVAGCVVDTDRARALAVSRSWAATTARRIGRWMPSGDFRAAGGAILQQYDWSQHLQAGAAHAELLSDELTRRLVLAGTVDDCVATIRGLAACGVGHIYPLFMGDDLDATVEAFGEKIIPACRAATAAERRT